MTHRGKQKPNGNGSGRKRSLSPDVSRLSFPITAERVRSDAAFESTERTWFPRFIGRQ